MKHSDRNPVVAVTRSIGTGAALVEELERRGIDVWQVPAIVHEPVEDPRAVDEAIDRLDEFSWVLFTSARAVMPVCLRPGWSRWPWASAAAPRIGAVGPSTSLALARQGVRVSLCPSRAGAGPLARAVIEAEGGTLEGRSVLWPRSEIARPELADLLRAARARVVDPVVYRTTEVDPEHLLDLVAEVRSGRIDAVTFLSPSSVASLAAAMPDGTLSLLAGRTLVASIGPTTSSALREMGAPPDVEALRPSGMDLGIAVANHLRGHQGVIQ